MKKPASVPESMKSKAKTVKVTVLVPVPLHRKFTRMAEKQRRSMSAQVLELAERGMEAAAAAQ